jgi:hypothetical protein
MDIDRIEKLPRTGDGHFFVATLSDGSRERVTLLNVPVGADDSAIEAVRAEVKRRIAARG